MHVCGNSYSALFELIVAIHIVSQIVPKQARSESTGYSKCDCELSFIPGHTVIRLFSSYII